MEQIKSWQRKTATPEESIRQSKKQMIQKRRPNQRSEVILRTKTTLKILAIPRELQLTCNSDKRNASCTFGDLNRKKNLRDSNTIILTIKIFFT